MIPVKPVTVREGRSNSSALSNQSLALPGDWEKLSQVRDTSQFLIPSGTAFVERDVLNVSERVHEVTNGKCAVASCQCGQCLAKGHFPHVVLENGRNGRTYPVFGFTSFGQHVIDRIREIHVSQKPDEKSRKKNEQLRRERKAQAVAVQDEKLEIIEAALKSSKHDWRGPDGLRTVASKTRL